MSPNFGGNSPGNDVVPDWLLGGDRKRRVLYALARKNGREGWTAAALSEEVGCGISTVHELLRGLQPLDLLESHPRGGVLLARGNNLGRALRRLILALAPLEAQPVERARRGSRRS
jgi:Mn-dependent DtxR family transcriptional regulator